MDTIDLADIGSLIVDLTGIIFQESALQLFSESKNTFFSLLNLIYINELMSISFEDFIVYRNWPAAIGMAYTKLIQSLTSLAEGHLNTPIDSGI